MKIFKSLLPLALLFLSFPVFSGDLRQRGVATPIAERMEKFGITMVELPTGLFTMGCRAGRDKSCEADEKPAHVVSVHSFEIGKTEVTQGQWKAVMGSAPSALRFKECGDNCPVEGVSFDDIQTFIQTLNAQTGKIYRLPSEAEWEYACRAGKDTNYCGGNDVGRVAWYGYEKSGATTHPVAGKQANAWGLYDMSGNVWERVQDDYHDDYKGAPGDGSVWHGATTGWHVLRGGAWFVDARETRAARRSFGLPTYQLGFGGFRLARTF